MRSPVSLLLAGLLLLGTMPPAQADTLVPGNTVLYLRQLGSDCGNGSLPRLRLEPGGSDELACGYVLGIPYGEIDKELGGDDGTTYSTEGGVPAQILDADRDVTGQLRVVPYMRPLGFGSGVGELVVDVAMAVELPNGNTQPIGSTTQRMTIPPGSRYEHFTWKFDIPAELHKATVTQVHLYVWVRGLHVSHGFTELGGWSYLDLPMFTRQP